jgi:hypothetical protein
MELQILTNTCCYLDEIKLTQSETPSNSPKRKYSVDKSYYAHILLNLQEMIEAHNLLSLKKIRLTDNITLNGKEFQKLLDVREMFKNISSDTRETQSKCSLQKNCLNMAKKHVRRKQHVNKVIFNRYVLLKHASECTLTQCPIKDCHYLKHFLIDHLKVCSNQNCTFPYCTSSRVFINHYYNCGNRCQVCRAFTQYKDSCC